MKLNTKRIILSAAGLFLSAGNALAEATNTTSTDVVANLGFLSGIAGTIVHYTKWGSILICLLTLFFLLAIAGAGKAFKKIEAAVNAKEGLKHWFAETILVVVALIVLFSWVIPTINGFVPQ